MNEPNLNTQDQWIIELANQEYGGDVNTVQTLIEARNNQAGAEA